MTRPALAHSNLEPIQAVLPHAEADKTPRQPFFKRCANIRTGSPEHKAVLLAHAAFCEVYTDGLSGTCLASGDTIRALSEVGRRRFWQLRRDLLDRGHLVVKRRQAGRTATVEVRATPDLLRAVDRQPAAPATGPEPSERRTQATLEDFLSRYPRGSHLDVTPGDHAKVPFKQERSTAPHQGERVDRSVQVPVPAPAASARLRSDAQAAAPRTESREEPERLVMGDGFKQPPRPSREDVPDDPDRLALLRQQALEMASDTERQTALERTDADGLNAARAAASEHVLDADVSPLDDTKTKCVHCGERIEGDNCPYCGNSNHVGDFGTSADRAGADQ